MPRKKRNSRRGTAKGGRGDIFTSGKVTKMNFYFAEEHIIFLDTLAKRYGVYHEEKMRNGKVRIMGRNEAMRRLIEEQMPMYATPKRSHTFKPSKLSKKMCELCSGPASDHPKKRGK